MTRLFTAIVPPAAAVAELAGAVAGPAPDGWRRVDPAGWHVTLAFHGDADPVRHAAALDTVRGLPGPRLRIDGSGASPDVRWATIAADPAAALLALVTAVGGDAAAFVPHLTLLRRRGRGRPEPPARLAPFTRPAGSASSASFHPPALLRGPWWRVDEVLLMASARTADGPRYTVVHRAGLAER